MKNRLFWIFFVGIFITLTTILLSYPPNNWAGDIGEYYSMTETIMAKQSLKLDIKTQASLEKVLPTAIFNDPQYYIRGTDGGRYPVHFFLYSLLLIPGRILLRLFGGNEINTFWITNVAILATTLAFIFHTFLFSLRKRLTLLFLVMLSPLIYFIAWPGPDLLYVCLMLCSMFLLYTKNIRAAALCAVIASWHSQPLLIFALGLLGYYVYQERGSKKSVGWSGFLLFLLGIPYVHNLLVFGVLTPWTLIQNGWTMQHGFGVQNMSLMKLYEMFFDLNMGLFWYIPVLFGVAAYMLIKHVRTDHKTTALLGLLIVTAFFYQTNPAWHYGTAGYGPTRHILYFIPFLFIVLIRHFKLRMRTIFIGVFMLLSQLYVLSFNGFLMPDFITVLYHTPYARYILDNYPAHYNPTPEIFVDRTNHTDLDHLTSAVYKQNRVCRKAFVLPADSTFLLQECGYMPQGLVIPEGGTYVNY